MPILVAVAHAGGFHHEAFVYRSVEEFVDFAVPFVEAGLAEGGEVFVAAAVAGAEALREALGTAPPQVTLHDTAEWAPHPATRLRAFHTLVTDRLNDGVPTLHLMGEPLWPAGPPAARREWARYESVLNHVLSPFPVTLVCLYDGVRLAPELVADAGRTHPHYVDAAGARPTGSFEPPATLLRRWAPAPSPAPAGATRLPAPPSVSAARRFVIEQAVASGVSAGVAGDLGIAASEVLTNAAVHGAGATLVAAWVEEGRFICQVEDAGPGIIDPFAGYEPPSTDDVAGRGLWLARQLTDLVEIAPTPGGTIVRLHAPVGSVRAA